MRTISLPSSSLLLGPLGSTAVARILCWVLVLACGGRFSDPVSLPHLVTTYIYVYLWNMQWIRSVGHFFTYLWCACKNREQVIKINVRTVRQAGQKLLLEHIVGQFWDIYPICRWENISYERRRDLSKVVRSDWSGLRAWVPLLPEQWCLLLEGCLGMRKSTLMVKAQKVASGRWFWTMAHLTYRKPLQPTVE